LEGFWGYLKRRLASKGGIRKEKLPLYLAEEYVWRFNHRNFTIKQQTANLLNLLYFLIFSG
jgi:transposase-like protein